MRVLLTRYGLHGDDELPTGRGMQAKGVSR
jgi:hypothetical protein